MRGVAILFVLWNQSKPETVQKDQNDNSRIVSILDVFETQFAHKIPINRVY